MKKVCIAFILINFVSIIAYGQSSDPDSAQIVTDDIGRFWSAFDQASPEFDSKIFAETYIDPGSVGLVDFVQARIESADKLADTIRRHSKYYASIRQSSQRVPEMQPAIRAAFYALKYLYTDAVFPDVYFLIGRMNSGGTTSTNGLLIGVEMYGKTPNMPLDELSDWHKQVLKPIEFVPHIVAHELIHYQQTYPDTSATLLSACIKEGVADFIAELISGRHINEHVHRYANPREEALWNEFKEKMQGSDYSGWLYGGDEASGRPADLGYWMGYKIAEAYYKQRHNGRQAVKDMLEIEDFRAFLEKSGYAEKFSK